jgi:hypothetical protein
MKNLLYLLLLCATPLCAQSEFGLSFKAGNFALPKHGPGQRPLGNTHSSNALSAGYTLSAGISENMHLNQRWSLQASLLYSLSAFSLKEDFNYDPQFEQYMLIENSWTRKYHEHNLMLPIQAQYHLNASGKTRLGLGVCPSFNLFTYQKATSGEPEPESLTVQQLQARAYFRPGSLATKAPRSQLLWMASLQQAIGKNTSIGIELLVATRRNNMNIYFNDYEDKMLPARSPFSMKSLQVSLSRTIVRH